jgi:micrococcal nuclease
MRSRPVQRWFIPLVVAAAVAVGIDAAAHRFFDPPPRAPVVRSPHTVAERGSASNAVVVRVVDGDTVDVRIGHHRERIRLIGVNTPETVDPRKPVECFGPEASAHTKHLLPPGTPVLVERDAEPRDDYGRLLAYVHRATDGLFVNLDLAERGFAVPLRIEPNSGHADEFQAAADRAMRSGLGLWSACRR